MSPSYLHSEALRREVQEALNVIERWNGTNGFIFYGKGGEVATNRLDDQEVSVLCLHLLQIALVYVNTLMIQNVLSTAVWRRRRPTGISDSRLRRRRPKRRCSEAPARERAAVRTTFRR